MAEKKSEADSAYWIVEQEALRMQARVAMAHAKRGGRTVLMTGRKLTEDQAQELQEASVEVVDTRGGR